jgi:Protein of unknown function (DUF429)
LLIKLKTNKPVPIHSWQLLGVDFTSSPSRRKAITVALGRINQQGTTVHLERLQTINEWATFEALLNAPGPWLGGFDFPFGLPRELVQYLHWPQSWAELMGYLTTLSRVQLRDTFKAFCDARPVGKKFAHRVTDIPAGSSSSMKWVNPPVAYMLHEGATRILKANVSVPGMHKGRDSVIALEAYPGLLARSITKASYKNDEKSKQTPERALQRKTLIAALREGRHPLELKLVLSESHADQLQNDASGDLLDAALCLVQAAWAARQGPDQHWGLPPSFDTLEGWIISASSVSASSINK